jgi:hypothetical protein
MVLKSSVVVLKQPQNIGQRMKRKKEKKRKIWTHNFLRTHNNVANQPPDHMVAIIVECEIKKDF